ncbi:uncharacterized protein LOC143839968 isoform X1 [Paroedura picta]|uniref:uncharacterized protein LOC143839968 isoform X1 n=1 Tax=Paroedura picta TaxID=143630 RepID=UPI0040571450
MSAVARMQLLIPRNSTFQIHVLEVYKLNIAKEYKSCLFLAAVLWVGIVCPQNASHPPYACQCLKDVKDREDCGHEGITAEQCMGKGCCFDATEPGVPWCFHPSGERVSLQYAEKMIKSQERTECGYPGITYKRCRRIGCCYDRKASDEPKCFHPPVNDVSRHCVMDRSARKECGHPGITAEECQERRCCFNSYVASTRWCFHPLPDTGPAQQCAMPPRERVQCGPSGITADGCLEKGCCYEHFQYAKKVPWCFEPLAKQGNFSV